MKQQHTPAVGHFIETGTPYIVDTSRPDGERLLLTAQSGAGKSFLARMLVETFVSPDNPSPLPVCIIDSESEFGSLKDAWPKTFVSVGPSENCDIPLSPEIVGQIGVLVKTEGASVIVDVAKLPPDERETIVAAIADAMMAVPLTEGRPSALVIDEADRFVGERMRFNGCRKAVEEIATAGRKRGLWLVAVTQRPGAISKTVLTQSNLRFIGKTSADTDGKRLQSELGLSRKDAARLPSLDIGEFFVCGTNVPDGPQRIRVAQPRSTHGVARSPEVLPEPITAETAVALLNSGSIKRPVRKPVTAEATVSMAAEAVDDLAEVLQLLAGSKGHRLNRDDLAVLTGWPARGKKLAEAIEAGKVSGAFRISSAGYVTATRTAAAGVSAQCPMERFARVRSELPLIADRIVAVLSGTNEGFDKAELATRLDVTPRSRTLVAELQQLARRRLLSIRRGRYALSPAARRLIRR